MRANERCRRARTLALDDHNAGRPGARLGLPTQGAQVVIGGRLRWRQYTTSDGAHRQAVDITADSIVPMRRTTTNEPTPEEIESAATTSTTT
jgi:hypothetical protein